MLYWKQITKGTDQTARINVQTGLILCFSLTTKIVFLATRHNYAVGTGGTFPMPPDKSA